MKMLKNYFWSFSLQLMIQKKFNSIWETMKEHLLVVGTSANRGEVEGGRFTFSKEKRIYFVEKR